MEKQTVEELIKTLNKKNDYKELKKMAICLSIESQYQAAQIKVAENLCEMLKTKNNKCNIDIENFIRDNAKFCFEESKNEIAKNTLWILSPFGVTKDEIKSAIECYIKEDYFESNNKEEDDD